MKTEKTKQKEIICLHTHRCKEVLLATMKSAPRNTLNIKRANKCGYLIFSLNENSNLYQDYLSSVADQLGETSSEIPPEFRPDRKHDEGFMICKISGIRKLSKRDHSNIHPDDPFYEITFKKHASIKIPSLYKNKKNPISYFPEDEILKMLNIQDFDVLEWSEENNLEPVFDDSDKYPVEARHHIEEQNRLEQLFRDTLAAFLEREMNEIIGSNVYLNDDEISKNLFVEQQKKRFNEGELKLDLPSEIKGKEGTVIKVLKTIEEWAEHQHWMMQKSYELQERTQKLADQKFKQGKDPKVTWEEYQDIAKEIGIEIEQGSNVSHSGGMEVNLNYVVPNEKKLDKESNKSMDFLDQVRFMRFGPSPHFKSPGSKEYEAAEDSDFTMSMYKIDDVKELSIDEAKIGLSRKYDIPIENIEVILKG
mgnify:CR=1 FL=1|tara:strand:+ start:747 stop:2009 length:1263 start_codon:yes stop_codon:yes gene_type:complete